MIFIFFIFGYDGCHNHSGEKIVSYLIFLIMDWSQKSLGVRCMFKEVAKKKQMSKDECESFYNQIKINRLV
jgi:hypothetical protein